MIVAVHPETGSLWKFGPERFEGRRSVALREQDLWRGVMEWTASPLVANVKPFLVLHRETLAEQRRSVREQLPIERPEDISEKSWQALRRWCEGYGYKALAKEMGISEAAVCERVRRALSRLGFMCLPGSMKRKRGRPRANALTRLCG